MRGWDPWIGWRIDVTKFTTFASMTQSTPKIEKRITWRIKECLNTQKGKQRNIRTWSNPSKPAPQLNGRRWFIWLHLLISLFFTVLSIKIIHKLLTHPRHNLGDDTLIWHLSLTTLRTKLNFQRPWGNYFVTQNEKKKTNGRKRWTSFMSHAPIN